MSAVAYADPTLDLATSLQDAEDRMGRWWSVPGHGVEVERPDGLQYQAVAYSRDSLFRRMLILKADADTGALALEELAMRGCQEGAW
jgi:hypothetical protein